MTHADLYPNLAEHTNANGNYEVFHMHADYTVRDEVAMRANHYTAVDALWSEGVKGDDDACNWALKTRTTSSPLGTSTRIVITKDAPERILKLAEDLIETAREYVVIDERRYYTLLDATATDLWNDDHAATINDALTSNDIDDADPDDVDHARTAYETETHDYWVVAIESDEPHDWAERFAKWYATTWSK